MAAESGVLSFLQEWGFWYVLGCPCISDQFVMCKWLTLTWSSIYRKRGHEWDGCARGHGKSWEEEGGLDTFWI